MRYLPKNAFFLVLFFVAAASNLAFAQTKSPEAFLRWDFAQNKYYIAVKADEDIDTTSTAYLGRIRAAIYQDGKLITAPTASASDGMGSDFTLFFDNTAWTDRAKALTLAIFSYPIKTGEGGFLAPVNIEFSVAVKQNSSFCERGFAILVDSEKYQPNITGTSTPEEIKRNLYLLRRAVLVQSSIVSNPPKARIEGYNSDGVLPAAVRIGKTVANPASASFSVCSDVETKVEGFYDLELSFQQLPPAADPPVELANKLLKLKIQVLSHKLPDAKTLDDAPKSTGKRPLDDNLDVQVVFTSSVKDEVRAGVPTRFRDTKWKGGIRFAPLLNALKEPDIDNNIFYFFTPVFVDARISSGKITKDTLSLNRIYIGSEFEIRHYSNPSTYPSYQRWIVRAQNASDRDFKQVEFTGGLEFQPVFSKLNRPLKWDVRSRKPTLNPDPKAAPINYSNTMGFGYQFLPQIGFQLGKTYRDKNSIATINKTDFVRRFYLGGTLNLDLTSYVRLSITDTLYFRGERPESVRHNYFNGTVEVPLPTWSNSIGNAFYVSFERGGQPPFAATDVNSFTAGYRLQWTGWFDKFR